MRSGWTIDSKIQIIRDFSPVPQPAFKSEDDVFGYIVWNLYNRTCEAIKSFLVLLDNRRYYDAFTIAGHALETCAVLSYIKDTEQREHFEQYFASSAVSRLRAMLEMDENLKEDISWLAHVSVLKMLYPVGTSIIKGDNATEKHKEAIEKLNSREGVNTDKIKLLTKYYDPISIAKYISSFSNNMNNIGDGQFAMYYTKYCNYKHSNMLAPCALAGDIDSEEVDWFLDLILGIIMYLDKSKLAPYKKVE